MGSYHQEYYLKHKDRIRIQQNEYYKQYYQNNKEKLLKQDHDYLINNRDKINNYVKERYKNDLSLRLSNSIRSRIRYALCGKSKGASSIELTGMPIEQLRTYLEDKFQEGMSWNNYGEWEIDHIRPCASFDLNDIEQQKECFNYKNLQPLWRRDNRSKKDKLI